MTPLWWHVVNGEAEANLRSCRHQGAIGAAGAIHHLVGSAAVGFDRGGIAKVIKTIERHMFYKSMTTHADHRVWQDVYHVPVENGPTLYVKFQANVVTEFTVMSFKEK
jgi:motility quorum-sensing regulator/GCU-specific mRNA interferase toxin